MQIDCDKAIMVSLKHDDKLPDGSEFAFQVDQIFCRAHVLFCLLYFECHI